jgi:hypothetical protein
VDLNHFQVHIILHKGATDATFRWQVPFPKGDQLVTNFGE